MQKSDLLWPEIKENIMNARIIYYDTDSNRLELDKIGMGPNVVELKKVAMYRGQQPIQIFTCYGQKMGYYYKWCEIEKAQYEKSLIEKHLILEVVDLENKKKVKRRM